MQLEPKAQRRLTSTLLFSIALLYMGNFLLCVQHDYMKSKVANTLILYRLVYSTYLDKFNYWLVEVHLDTYSCKASSSLRSCVGVNS